MKRVLLAVLLSPLLATTADAGTRVSIDRCEVDSEYGLRLGRDGITLRRVDGAPREVRLSGARLWIDGQEQALSSNDRRTVAAIQQEVDALLPEVREIAVEAVGIAVEALVQVAHGLGGDDGAALGARLRKAQDAFVARLDQSLADGDWDSAAMEDEIEALVSELAPQVAGDIAALAVRAAFSGDADAARDIERRAAEMERNLKAEMERRATTLEARAEALCPRLQRLDELEDALELRLADGSRLDLVQR